MRTSQNTLVVLTFSIRRIGIFYQSNPEMELPFPDVERVRFWSRIDEWIITGPSLGFTAMLPQITLDVEERAAVEVRESFLDFNAD